MNELFPFLSTQTLDLIIKVVLLILIGLYGIFVFIVFQHIRSLNKILTIQKSAGSSLVQTLSIFYLIAALSLFLLSLAIL